MYIIDAYAVLELETLVPAGRKRIVAFDRLTKLVEESILAFPDTVLADCKHYGEGDVGTVWLLGAASLRKRAFATFPGSTPMEVLELCPELCASEMIGDQSHIDVACLAHHISKVVSDVVVVTEDPGIGGVRLTLAEACDVLGIEHCGVQKMLYSLGLGLP